MRGGGGGGANSGTEGKCLEYGVQSPVSWAWRPGHVKVVRRLVVEGDWVL